jgi:hypothetical protein
VRPRLTRLLTPSEFEYEIDLIKITMRESKASEGHRFLIRSLLRQTILLSSTIFFFLKKLWTVNNTQFGAALRQRE